MKKESVLEEEAYIYNRHEEQNEKDKWKRLNRQQRINYFNDYYRNKIIAVIIILALFGYLLYTALSPKPDTVVSVAVVNDYWDDAKTEELTKDLSTYLELEEGKQEIFIDDAYFLESNGSGAEMANIQRLVAKLAAGDVNVIIADKAKFEEFAADETFIKISEVMDDSVPYKDRLTSDGYGISLKDCPLMKELGSYQSELILAVVANTDNEDYKFIAKMVKYILQKA